MRALTAFVKLSDATVDPSVSAAVATGLLCQRTVWGRHLFALGRNEEAARFSGVPTRRLTAMSYVACSLLAGLGGCLFVLDVNSAQASNFGNFYELYAIAGAVLGGVARALTRQHGRKRKRATAAPDS